MPEADDDEAVRIFVEFERMESAIKGEDFIILWFKFYLVEAADLKFLLLSFC